MLYILRVIYFHDCFNTMRNWNNVVFAISYVTIYCDIFVLKTEQEEVNVCLKVITWKPLYYWAIQNRNIYLWYIFILMIFSPLSSIATVILVDNSLQKVFNRKTNGGRSIHLHLLVFFVFNMYASWYKIKPQKIVYKIDRKPIYSTFDNKVCISLGISKCTKKWNCSIYVSNKKVSYWPRYFFNFIPW